MADNIQYSVVNKSLSLLTHVICHGNNSNTTENISRQWTNILNGNAKYAASSELQKKDNIRSEKKMTDVMSLLQIFTHCNYTEMLANFINNCKLEQNTKLYIPGISSEAKFNEIRDICTEAKDNAYYNKEHEYAFLNFNTDL